MKRVVRMITALLLLSLGLSMSACDAGELPEETVSSADESGQDTAEYTEGLIGKYLDDYFTLKNPADNNPAPESFFIIDSYEGLTELYEYINNSDLYTLRHNTGAYADMTAGKYTEQFFADGGRLAAVPVGTASGSYTYYTYTEKKDSKFIIHLNRLNSYITVSTDDLGRFVYLVPLPTGYTKEQISVIRNESCDATNAAFRAGQEEIENSGMFSGTYKRYDGKPYYTEGFWAVSWAYLYDETNGEWMIVDGFGHRTQIEMNRDKIPAVKITDGMGLFFATGNDVKSVQYLLLDTDLETEREISSLAELQDLPAGGYYLVCKVLTEGRTVAGNTEQGDFSSIYLVEKSDYNY